MGVRARALRRTIGRVRSPDDIVAGEWVWPYWLERQLDPRSPAFVPTGQLPALTNVTQRNWTMLGNVSARRRAIVDPRGLVTPWLDGWSLDWWIRGQDRWHFPSRETAVRQWLLARSPVVETVIRVPGGDALQRSYALNTTIGEVAVVEIENRSTAPFAVALTVRPYNPAGLAVVKRIGLHDGRVVSVDGRPALLLPKPPAAAAASTFADGDVAVRVGEGPPSGEFAWVRCEAGIAQAVFLYPLASGATLSTVLPLASQRRSRLRAVARRRASRYPEFPRTLASASTAARGWEMQARRGMTIVLPEGRLADTVEANRKYLLLFHEGADVTPGPFSAQRVSFREAAYLLAAMDRYGFHDEAAQVLRSYPGRQHLDGYFFSGRQEWDANGCAIHAVANHWRLSRDVDLLEELAPSVALGARWIERHRLRSRRGRRPRRARDPAFAGLMPPGFSARHLGGFDLRYWDDFWSLGGLLDATEILGTSGNHYGASVCRSWASAFRRDLEASLALVAERANSLVIPAGPRRGVDHGVIASLVACEPLRLFSPEHPAVVATLEELRDRSCIGDAFFQAVGHAGLGTYLTLQLAAVELARGDRRALDRLAWLTGHATSTGTWPAAIHPQLGGGCMGDGHNGWAAAEFLTFVRNMLVREVHEPDAATGESHTGLSLCTMLPEAWEGEGLEVHDAPTEVGRLSFALRWHGERPALLWELTRHEGVGPVRLTAPGLDPSWSSVEPRGEALLVLPGVFNRTQGVAAHGVVG